MYLEHCTCIGLALRLIQWTVSILCGWLEWLLWFWFLNIHLLKMLCGVEDGKGVLNMENKFVIFLKFTGNKIDISHFMKMAFSDTNLCNLWCLKAMPKNSLVRCLYHPSEGWLYCLVTFSQYCYLLLKNKTQPESVHDKLNTFFSFHG